MGTKKNVYCGMGNAYEEQDYIKITNVPKGLRKDLKIIADKKSHATLSSFLRSELRSMANKCLAEYGLKPSNDTNP